MGKKEKTKNKKNGKSPAASELAQKHAKKTKPAAKPGVETGHLHGQATPADAELLLRLYDLRREDVMRRARNYVAIEFFPESAEEIMSILQDFGSERNAFFRQVLSYWDMAAAMVLTGALNEQLFFMTNGEPYFIYAKFKPFLEQIRAASGNPRFLTHLEEVANISEDSRTRIEQLQQTIQRLRHARAAKAHSA
ncbi:MAG TPA: hypothetical protein VKZ53_03415 [Candidatus Angelobacter sp.]|nr:hypothetical protein [Candidatus Angelobacter sp.]